MIETEEKTIADLLIANAELDLFQVHLHTRIAPARIAKAVVNLRKMGLLVLDDLRAIRTAHFQTAIFTYRHEIYNRGRPWAKRLPNH